MIFHVGNRRAAEEAIVHVGSASDTADMLDVLYRWTTRLRKWYKGGIEMDLSGFTIGFELFHVEVLERYGVLFMCMAGSIVGYITSAAFLADEDTELLVKEESQGVQER
jgi:hypothetical protein